MSSLKEMKIKFKLTGSEELSERIDKVQTLMEQINTELEELSKVELKIEQI